MIHAHDAFEMIEVGFFLTKKSLEAIFSTLLLESFGEVLRLICLNIVKQG